jgi:hypothetical protein
VLQPAKSYGPHQTDRAYLVGGESGEGAQSVLFGLYPSIILSRLITEVRNH